jgi:16S rRNA (guanine527-N7)-methyltransferase
VLLEWNSKMNLTAITDERDIIIKHFLDSVSCLEFKTDFSGRKVIDVGTGAGFPGVPLKIVKPDIKLTLLDSLKKRTVFLADLMQRLNLECEIVHGRAEEMGVNPKYREKYDIVLSRAVASMNILLEYTLPFAKVGGYFICQKGPGVFEEAEEAKKAVEVLGGSIEGILPTNVYGSDFSHYITAVKKVKLCPGKYPRKAGTAEKKPII